MPACVPDRFRAIAASLAIAALALNGTVPALARTARAGPSATPDAAERFDLRCSAAFAIVALQQADGEGPAGWPALARRGKTFFADTGERVMHTTGLSREAVRDLMVAEVQTLQQADDPDGALAALAPACTARLDAAVPPLVTPGLALCAALLDRAGNELAARDGLSPQVRDLRTLASVLAARARAAVTATGAGGGAADRALAEAREALDAELARAPDAAERYDIDHCYDLAKPEARSHY